MDDKNVFLRAASRAFKGKLVRVETLNKLLGYMRSSLFYDHLIARNLLLEYYVSFFNQQRL